MHVAAQFCEILHVGDLVLDADVVNAADKPEVVHARERALETAAQGKRPGNAHAAVDGSFVRILRAADEADEGGLPRAVATEDAELLATVNPQIHAVQDRAQVALERVALGEIVDGDHRRLDAAVGSDSVDSF